MKYIVLVQYYTFHLNFSHQKVFTQPLKILFLRKFQYFTIFILKNQYLKITAVFYNNDYLEV